MTLDEQNIRDVHVTWINAINSGDLVSLLALMTNDVIFLNPGQSPFGKDEFSKNFSAVPRQAKIHCSSELEEVVAVGEIAYTRSRDALSITPLTVGVSKQLTGHRITIYRRQSNGSWLLARDAHTLSSVE